MSIIVDNLLTFSKIDDFSANFVKIILTSLMNNYPNCREKMI